MHLNFMTPDVWNGLVIGSILIGLALAALRIMHDWSLYQKQHSKTPLVKPEDTHRQDQL
jgi:hypothetical protein